MEGHHDGYDPVSSKMSGFKQRVKIESPPRQAKDCGLDFTLCFKIELFKEK